ncbi:MAG: hypothetical protein RLO18_29130, partial [Gimesia chilikensis]
GFVVSVAVVGLLLLRIYGLNPQDQRPGLWLSGNPIDNPVSNWSFTDDVTEIFVQTRTPYFIPHSVTAYCTVYNGDLYLFSAYYEGGDFPDTRSWNRNVIRDPRVRLKLGEGLYDVTLQHISDDSIRIPVIRSFEAKYSQWGNPGDQNVHIFLVES